jgi:MFS family permease
MAGSRLSLHALVAANALSLLGNALAAVALPWLVLVTTGSAAKTGLTAFVTTIPFALGALFGGAVADRIGAKTTSVLGDLASAVAAAAIPLLHLVGVLAFWQILVIGFARSVCDAPGTAARRALVPALAEDGRVSLERANSLYTGTEHFGYVLGAPLGGALIAALGAANVLWVDAASFVFSAGLVALAVKPLALSAARVGRYVGDLIDGLRFLVGDRAIFGVVVVHSAGSFLAAWIAPVILPVYARDVFHSAFSLGLMVGAFGVGGLLGTITFGVMASRLDRRTTYLGSFLVYAPVTAALIPLPRLAVALAALFLLGFFAGVDVPIEQTVIQERTPAELRGRVYGLFLAGAMFAVPLGMLVAGAVVEALGLGGAIATLSVGFALLAVAAVANVRGAEAAYSRA